MPKLNLARLREQFRQGFARLKSDPALLGELRYLGLGLLVCATVAYGGHSILLAPQQQKVREQLKTKAALLAKAPGIMDAELRDKERKLRRELQQIREEQAIFALQKRFFTEQWRAWGDEEQFTRAILTLEPNAPVSLEKSFKQLSHLEPRSRQGITAHPLKLAGSASFQNLFDYLRYLENKPEVRLLDELVVERIPVEGYERPAKISFSLTVGRLSLSEEDGP